MLGNKRALKFLLCFTAVGWFLSGCSSMVTAPTPSSENNTSRDKTVNTIPPSTNNAGAVIALPPVKNKGGYYLDDGPGENPPENLLTIPDAQPKIEPYAPRGNNPYVVFGKTYVPMLDDKPFKQRGVGSWYGKKFHGQKTSTGEPYDMYKMTAAHPTLPIPSYVRVTNTNNGKQVVVRVNDRGPFHSERIIDLSYTAALKLGYLDKGSSTLEIERVLPDDIALAKNPDMKVLSQKIRSDNVREIEAMLQNDVNPTMSVSMIEEVPQAEKNNYFYIQIGAYGKNSNAEAERQRWMQANPLGLPPFSVEQVGGLFRVYNGPFISKTEAATALQQMQEKSPAKLLIVQR